MNTQISTRDKFKLAFQAEGLKLKRRKMIKLSYLIPLAGIVFLIIGVTFADRFKDILLATDLVTLENVLDGYIGFFMFIMFPIMIAVYTASISSIEREAKTAFTIGVLPTSPFIVFLTKIFKNLINTIIGVFIGLVSVMLFAVIANNYLEWFPKDYSFMYFVERVFYGELGSLMFLPIIILHTWLGERFSIKLLNMFSIMFVGFVTTAIATKGYLYLPYTLPFELLDSYFSSEHSFLVSIGTYLAYLFGMLYLVYLDYEKNIFKRKK